jgi:hypothetical protein
MAGRRVTGQEGETTMRIAKLALAGTLAGVLAGCGIEQFTSKPVTHSKSTKKECAEVMAPPGCEIPVDPSKPKWVDDVVVLPGMGARDIVFVLVSGYEFAANNGIKVDAPEEKYKCKRKDNEPRKVECKYRRDAFGVHKYTINVTKSGSALPPYDPFLINE